MLERLWSGWRASYVTSKPAQTTVADDGLTVFSRLLGSGLSDDEAHIVHRGETCFVVVNAFPYTSGHLLVVPYREVADLDDLDAAELAELWVTVGDGVRAVRVAYEPEGLNVGLNLGRPAGGSVPDHLHVHVVPRWIGDSNFMSAIANTQTIPESLGETTRKLRAVWSSGS